MNDMHNFTARKNRAIDELKQMNQRAPKNDVIFKDIPPQTPHLNGKTGHANFNFLSSGDDLLIIGLIIILYEDCHDMWLFLALIYILL